MLGMMTSLCGNSRVLRSNSPGFEFRLAASLICPEANYFTSPQVLCLFLIHATGMIVRSFLGLEMTPVRCLFPATWYLQHLLDHQILHQGFTAAADASITPAFKVRLLSAWLQKKFPLDTPSIRQAGGVPVAGGIIFRYLSHITLLSLSRGFGQVSSARM